MGAVAEAPPITADDQPVEPAADASTDEERRAKRAQAERDRRAQKKAEAEKAERAEAREVVHRAKEIAPNIKSPFEARSVISLRKILGKTPPLEAPGLSDEALAGRTRRDVIELWACDKLAKTDPAASELRAYARKLSADKRGVNLWGRKVGVLLLALADQQG